MLRFTNMGVAGFLPTFFTEGDPRPAKVQLNERYAHGGGWHSMNGFKYENGNLIYPGSPEDGEDDEVFLPKSEAVLHDKEKIILFECDFVMVLNIETNEFEVTRCD